MKNPRLTIVTVSYNAAGEIGKTIDSVGKQTWTDFEYLFIDGASQDATVECIAARQETFAARKIPYRWISEPDKGIYDAMNKAIRQAEGQWILMLNAGDVLASDDALERVFGADPEDTEVLYGHMVVSEAARGRVYYRKVPAKPLEYLEVGMPFCHQSVFVRTEVLRRFPFDTKYRIVADYHQFLRLWREGAKFRPVDVYVSVFDNAGVSMRDPLKTLREYDRVRQDMGLSGTSGAVQKWMARGKGALRNTIRKLLPGWFYSQARGWQETFPEDI